MATLEQQAAELAARVDVDRGLPPAEALAAALDAFLGWVEEHAEGYGKLLVGAATHPEVRELVEGVRAQTAERILAGLAPAPAAAGGARRGAAAGSGSWTGCSPTGSSTATSTATRCAACCWGRSSGP